jgi:hypothetical protein
MSAQVLERWLDRPTSAEHLIRERRQLLPHMLPELRVLEEPSHVEVHSSGSGCTMSYCFRDGDDVPLRQRMVLLSQGPLQCELTVTRIDEPDPARDALMQQIASTFTLLDLDHISTCTPEEVVNIKPAASLEGSQATARPFPRLCTSLPTPQGWSLVDDGDSVTFDSGQSRIRVCRELQFGGDPEVWFTTRLHHVQDTKGRVVAYQRGELDDGRTYASLLYEEGGTVSTWHTEAASCILELMIDGDQPLVWTVTGNEYGVKTARPILENLVASTASLDPAEWQTRIAEPWLDLTLHGDWKQMDTGLYVKVEDDQVFRLIYLVAQDLESPVGLRKNEETMVSSVSSAFSEIHSQQHAFTEHRGLPELSYAADGSNSEGLELAVRALWVDAPRKLYTLFVQSTNSSAATSLFSEARAGLQIEGGEW